ncbi:gamma carbonic anhydrase 1, partial [Striga asiatica]
PSVNCCAIRSFMTECWQRINYIISVWVIWGGNPAKFLRTLTDDEIAFISQSATNYASLAQAHTSENAKEFDKVEFEKVLRKKLSGVDEAYGSLLGAVRESQPELANNKAAY